MIGIIVADENELRTFPWKIKEKKQVNQFIFTIYDNDIVTVHSGIGIANAASATQQMISSFKVQKIYNYGAVGGNQNINVYDIITPSKIFYHDVITPWYQRGQTPGEAEFYKNSLSSNKNNNLASGSSFLANEEDIKNISLELNVDIFDMETAAIAQVCSKNHVPLEVIKCVSDAIGVTDTQLEDINTRIAKAGELAFEKMLEIIEA